MPDGSRKLRVLARLSGIAADYISAAGEKQTVPDEILLKLLGAIDPETSPDTKNTEKTISRRRRKAIDDVLPGTVIAWDGRLPALWIWLKNKPSSISLFLRSDQTHLAQTFPFSELENLQREIEGKTCYRIKLALDHDIPFDTYNLKISTDSGIGAESFLISAPSRLDPAPKTWGAFAPAYAIRSDETRAIGGYREVFKTAEFLGRNGAGFLGTLPLLPLDGGDAPSPYSPMSRLFLNDIYLDIDDLPGFDTKNGEKLRKLNSNDLVEHQEVSQLKRGIIQQAADNFFDRYPEGDVEFKKFRQDAPYLDAYASFCAGGDIEKKQYHLYAQYACHRQLRKLKDKADDGKAAQLYLDYPIGVHPSGFDAHYFKNLFIQDLSVGAPPDRFFSGGQNWGFRPFHPRKIEDEHYSYFRACLRHHFRYSKMLRLDHIMGFYRIYCVDEENHGSYIYYNFDALLALLLLEAWRHDAHLIGENLGVVPEIVNIKMKKHGLNKMWIAQFDIKPDPAESFAGIEPAMLAAINTHDMAPFEAFRTSRDIEKLQELGLKDDKEARQEKDNREKLLKSWNRESLYMDLVEGMAASPASFVMLTLEDLWKETNSQNLPGTMDNHPNWKRRFAVPFEKWPDQKILNDAFKILNKYRGQTSL